MAEFENEYAGLPLHQIFKVNKEYTKEELENSFHGLQKRLREKRRAAVRVKNLTKMYIIASDPNLKRIYYTRNTEKGDKFGYRKAIEELRAMEHGEAERLKNFEMELTQDHQDFRSTKQAKAENRVQVTKPKQNAKQQEIQLKGDNPKLVAQTNLKLQAKLKSQLDSLLSEHGRKLEELLSTANVINDVTEDKEGLEKSKAGKLEALYETENESTRLLLLSHATRLKQEQETKLLEFSIKANSLLTALTKRKEEEIQELLSKEEMEKARILNEKLVSLRAQHGHEIEAELLRVKADHDERLASRLRDEEEANSNALALEVQRQQRLREEQLQFLIDKETYTTAAVIKAETSRLEVERKHSLRDLKLKMEKEIKSEKPRIKPEHVPLGKEDSERHALIPELDRPKRLQEQQLQLLILVDNENGITAETTANEKDSLASERQHSHEDMNIKMDVVTTCQRDRMKKKTPVIRRSLEAKYSQAQRKMCSKPPTNRILKRKTRIRELQQSYLIYRKWRQRRRQTDFAPSKEADDFRWLGNAGEDIRSNAKQIEKIKRSFNNSAQNDSEDKGYEFLEPEPAVQPPISTGETDRTYKQKHTRTCVECGKIFAHCSSLSRHKKEHKSPQAALKCAYCHLQMFRLDQFDKHSCKERRMSTDFWKTLP